MVVDCTPGFLYIKVGSVQRATSVSRVIPRVTLQHISSASKSRPEPRATASSPVIAGRSDIVLSLSFMQQAPTEGPLCALPAPRGAALSQTGKA